MKGTNIITVFRKETRDLFRDRRTVLMGIIIPVILFPLILFYLNIVTKKSRETIDRELKISISEENSYFSQFLKRQKNLKIISTANPKDGILNGKIYTSVIIPRDFNRKIDSGKNANIEILINNSSHLSILACERIRALAKAYSGAVAKRRLIEKRIDPSIIKPVNISKKLINEKGKGSWLLLLSILLPLMILSYSVISPLAVAVDLGVGEKERGTLEQLLCTSAGRLEILCGKFFSITLFGIIGVLSFLTGVILSFIITPDFFSIKSIDFSIKASSILIISLLTLALIMIFGAAEFSLSLFSRSSRESQILSLPLIILSMASGYGSYMIDIKNYPLFYLNIPLLNISIVLKEVILETYNSFHIILISAWSLFYIALAMTIAAILFSKEKIIYRN